MDESIHHSNGQWPNLRAFLEEIDKRNDTRFAGSDRFHTHQFDAIRTELAERDTRYQQRFDAQEKAVRDALAAAKEAVGAALTAADRAVAKAETAAERRFDSVNEFRAQLADQASTFISRNEYSTQHQSLIDKLEASTYRLDERITALAKYQANVGGLEQGRDKAVSISQARIALVIAGLSAFGTVAFLVAAIVTHGKF